MDDLFAPGGAPLGAIADLVIADVTVQRGSPPPEQGTNPTAANYEDYILTDDALVFFFEPYQMGAYAEGTFEVAIPLAALADELAP